MAINKPVKLSRIVVSKPAITKQSVDQPLIPTTALPDQIELPAVQVKVPTIINVTQLDRDPNRVTILMTCYNCEDYIGRAIESVINQTYKNWELLIIDDMSIDSSLSIICEFAKKDSRIRVFRNLENAGTYWSKNAVLKHSTGAFITCLDSDDIDSLVKLEKQVRMFRLKPLVKCVRCKYERLALDASENRITVGYASAMFRAEVFDKIGYYDTTRFGADSEFFDRINRVYGKRATQILDDILQTGPVREDSLTSQVPYRHEARTQYIDNFKQWHASTDQPYIGFPLDERPFPIHERMIVPNFPLTNQIKVT
jgi:glycosyltransferase involved in cell wall biosynthesis